MANYDFVMKAYAGAGLGNLTPSSGSEPGLVPVSATRDRLEMVVATSSGVFTIEAIGAFEFTEPLTPTTVLGGTVSSWKAYFGGLLWFEEIFPAGTSAAAWTVGDYSFQLSLLGGNDYFAGSPLRHEDSSDGVRGGDGHDTFIGYGSSPWDDEFYGESGIDTSIYRGKLSEYVVERSDSISDGRLNYEVMTSGYIVTDTVTARDDTDRLVGVERLQFSDVTLALDIDGVAAEAYRIYKAAFDRQPDSSGLGFWIKQMDAGMSLEAVAQEFISSPEFVRMYGANTSDEQFVDLLYANVLDRQADQSGYDFWIAAFDRGLTRAGLLAEFSESRENIANVAPLIENGIQYTAYLG